MSKQLSENKAEFVRLTQSGPMPQSGQVALVPGTDAPVLALDLPDTLRGRAREQVARRQLQDALGAGHSIEMRPFLGTRDANHWTRAVVADGALLEGWRAAAGENCRAVLPDYLSLPAAPGMWTVEQQGNDVLVRLGLEDGFSADPDMAKLMLSQALAEHSDPPQVVLQLGAPLSGLGAMMQTAGVKVVGSVQDLSDLGLEAPKVLGHGELGLDLRSDPQAARQRLRAQVLPWRLPVVLGLVAAGLWAMAQIVTTNKIDDELDRERQETLALTRAHFVPSGPVLDIRVQVSNALAARRKIAEAWQGRVSPLVLLGQAAEVVARQNAEPDQISYKVSEGATLLVQVADFAAVDRLVAGLQDAGLDVELTQSSASEDLAGVQATLRLKSKSVANLGTGQ